MTGRLILWLCIIWLVPLMYVMLRNETKFKKNIVLGVTLPYQGRTDPEVMALLARFKKRLGLVCLALLALAVGGIFLPVSFGVSLTLFLVWTDLCIVLPYLPYVACNRKLKELKAERGWRPAREETEVAELTVAAQPLKELSVLHFLLPFAISLVPVAWELVRGNGLLALLLLIDAACVPLFYGLYRWCYRRKAETVDDNVDLTAALTRLRRQYWIRCWVWCSWFMGLLNLGIWLMVYRPIPGFALVGVLTLGLVAAVMGVEFRLRRAQERLTRESGRGFYVDADDKWIWGLFYYDPHDSHLIINNRVGSGSTVNLARRGGQVLTGIVAALLIFMPLMGVGIMAEERSPVTLELTDTRLVAAHGGSEYEVALDDILRAELLDQRPTGLSRTWGTGMDTVQKGRYQSPDYGAMTLCLDPRTGPWLLVTTREGKIYLFGAPGSTEGVYEALISGTAPADR